MVIFHHILLFFIGLIGSFFSGLLGIGGAIINFPLLLYVPTWFHLGSFTSNEVASISMFQVFFASLSGVIAYRKQNKNGSALVHKELVLVMGSSILVGSLLGGIGSKFLPNQTINLIYGILAVIGIILMLIPTKESKAANELVLITFHKTIAIISAFLVGVISGIVGAGGAFILIPIMLTILKIPIRVTIASSLAIVFISSIGGMIGKIFSGHIPVWATVFAVLGSLIGAPIGSWISHKLNVKVLRFGLVILIAFTAIKIWTDILG